MVNNKTSSDNEEKEKSFAPELHKVSGREFLRKRRESKRPYVFDLRTPEEYEAGHIYSSYSLPLNQLEYAIYQLPYNENLLFYGSGLGETLKAGEVLNENCFESFFFADSYDEIINDVDSSMIEITPVAREKISEKLNQEPDLRGIRIIPEAKSPLRAKYYMDFVNNENQNPNDIVVEVDQIKVFINPDLITFFEDTKVDFMNDKFEASNQSMEVSDLNGTVKERLEKLIEEQINPSLASHGGSVSLVDIKGGDAYVVLGGGCQGCAMARITMKQGVEAIIKDNIPEIVAVHDTTDHSKSGSAI